MLFSDQMTIALSIIYFIHGVHSFPRESKDKDMAAMMVHLQKKLMRNILLIGFNHTAAIFSPRRIQSIVLPRLASIQNSSKRG
jgi:hypothetical protein